MIAKTIVATGATSGLGFEMVKQLLSQVDQPYRLILGARDTAKARTDLDSLGFDAARHSLTVLPLELTDLAGVRTFAKKALEDLGRSGDGRLDYLVLNAGAAFPADKGDSSRSKWCDTYIINYLSQHYLTHLLREKLVASRSRIVVVSSGAVQNVPDPTTLAETLKLGSGAVSWKTYPASKFLQLLTAHWWRRELHGVCDVVAVSPGLIPGTGLGRGADFQTPPNVTSAAKSIPTGKHHSSSAEVSPSHSGSSDDSSANLCLARLLQEPPAFSRPSSEKTSPTIPTGSSSPAGASGGPPVKSASLSTSNYRTGGLQARRKSRARRACRQSEGCHL
ncbi:hypothetical protein RB595_008098 [Gaeumannomyces hyphopodioides]